MKASNWIAFLMIVVRYSGGVVHDDEVTLTQLLIHSSHSEDSHILKNSTTSRQRSRRLRFEEQYPELNKNNSFKFEEYSAQRVKIKDNKDHQDMIRFMNENELLQFPTYVAPQYHGTNINNSVKFEEDSVQRLEIKDDSIFGIRNQQNMIKFMNENESLQPSTFLAPLTKERKRRKPRQFTGHQAGFHLDRNEFPYQHFQMYSYPGQSNRHPSYGLLSQYYRPQRPGLSKVSEALTSITDALTSIAAHDDYQCVPRLLCEAAGSSTSTSSGLLQSLTGLEPLLILLSAYNGVSSSPLFIFGRAVLLGMTSKNPGTCRYAYPLCPTDPEKLVYYLNNHNGGFFRFFNKFRGVQNSQGNLQQFYNHLSLTSDIQNYGLGIQNQYLNINYGIQAPQQQNIGSYGLLRPQNPNYGYYGGAGYAGSFQGYRFGTNQYNNNIYMKESNNKIEKRIQNISNSSTPFIYVFDGNKKNKFTFPREPKLVHTVTKDYPDTRNEDKAVKFFPSYSNQVSAVEGFDDEKKGFMFPGKQSNRKHIEYYNYPPLSPTFNYDHLKHGISTNVIEGDNDKDVEIVYVVRGNGDPNNPEVVKLRPGQKII